MTFPNGSGGYQVGAGNLNEVLLTIQPTPTEKSGTATLTAAELATGIIYYTGPTATITLPDASTLDVNTSTYSAPMSNAKPNSAFDLSFMNVGGGTLTINASTNPGWTSYGTLTIATLSTSIFRFRKTADGTWSVYRVG